MFVLVLWPGKDPNIFAMSVTTTNMHMKSEIEIPKQTKVTVRKLCR